MQAAAYRRPLAPLATELRRASRAERLIFFAPCALLLALLPLKLLDKELYWRLVVEDGWFENVMFVIYAITAATAFALGLALRREGLRWAPRLQFLLAAGFLFICLEEISYGQRFFQIQSPEFFAAYNRQQETNLHNFARRPILHLAYILVGLYGATAWLLMPQRLRSRLGELAPLLAPPWLTALYFLPAVLLYGYFDYVSAPLTFLFGPAFDFDRGMGYDYFFMARDQEVPELLLAFGFLIWQGLNWRRRAALYPDAAAAGAEPGAAAA